MGQAAAILLLLFTVGGAANAGRAMLMKMSGSSNFFYSICYPLLIYPGQRIVARLREHTYAASLRQEVEFVERGEGDVLSRLSVDTSIVGERYDFALHKFHSPSDMSTYSVTQNLSDGLRAVVMASVGCMSSLLHFRLALNCSLISGGYVLPFTNIDHVNAWCGAPGLSWCGMYYL